MTKNNSRGLGVVAALTLLFCCLVGALFVLFWGSVERAYHWRKVNSYILFWENEYKQFNHKDSTLDGWTLNDDEPSCPMDSYLYLLAHGEISYFNLVLPTVAVNEQSLEFWRTFVRTNNAIIDGFSNPIYAAHPIQGVQPLHLQLLVRAGYSEVVNDLIDGLEGLEGERRSGINPENSK